MKRTYNKREIITDTRFDFTKQRIQYQIQYQGNGKAPDKRFDRSTQGLSLFIYPSGVKVFCAFTNYGSAHGTNTKYFSLFITNHLRF